MQAAPDAAGGSSPKRCGPALSTVHELLLRLQQPPQPQDSPRMRFEGTHGWQRALLLWVLRLSSGNATESPVSLLGLVPGNPKTPNQLGETPLKPCAVQDCREVECWSWGGLGGQAGPCWDSWVPVLAVRHHGMGSLGCCTAQRTGLPEHSHLTKAGRPWEERAGLHRALQKASAWAEKSSSHAGLSVEPLAGASAVPAEAGRCWRDRAAMRVRRGCLAACQITGHISRFKSRCDLFGRTCQRLAGFPPLMKGAKDV